MFALCVIEEYCLFLFLDFEGEEEGRDNVVEVVVIGHVLFAVVASKLLFLHEHF